MHSVYRARVGSDCESHRRRTARSGKLGLRTVAVCARIVDVNVVNSTEVDARHSAVCHVSARGNSVPRRRRIIQSEVFDRTFVYGYKVAYARKRKPADLRSVPRGRGARRVVYHDTVAVAVYGLPAFQNLVSRQRRRGQSVGRSQHNRIRKRVCEILVVCALRSLRERLEMRKRSEIVYAQAIKHKSPLRRITRSPLYSAAVSQRSSGIVVASRDLRTRNALHATRLFVNRIAFARKIGYIVEVDVVEHAADHRAFGIYIRIPDITYLSERQEHGVVAEILTLIGLSVLTCESCRNVQILIMVRVYVGSRAVTQQRHRVVRKSER